MLWIAVSLLVIAAIAAAVIAFLRRRRRDQANFFEDDDEFFPDILTKEEYRRRNPRPSRRSSAAGQEDGERSAPRIPLSMSRGVLGDTMPLRFSLDLDSEEDSGDFIDDAVSASFGDTAQMPIFRRGFLTRDSAPVMNTEEYGHTPESGFQSAVTSPFSTFAADVDTASYANMRRQVLQGRAVRPDSIRIEQLVNYFRYSYPEPTGSDPFSVTTGIAACPWNPDTQLLRIGLQAKNLDKASLPKSNLVFLLDVSGSMDDPAKLPLVQRSFMTLTESLREDDTVSIVTYASGEKLVLDGEPVRNRSRIMSAIEELEASGSTNGRDALLLAYETAKKHLVPGGNNRVIMATDGDFNVGITDTGSIARIVEEKSREGVALSVLGFGMGNYKDDRLETLANAGRGNYAYIDTVDEARKVLVDQAGGNLFTVARDVKLQVEFNPAYLKGYRLIGYENRRMAAEDFADDRKAGGEIGAGHQVTALYEIVPQNSAFEVPGVATRYGGRGNGLENGEIAMVSVRYKEPEGEQSILLEYPVGTQTCDMDGDFSWAAGVAQVGMLLADSDYAGTSSLDEVRRRLGRIPGVNDDDFRTEFLYLMLRMRRAEEN